MLYICTKNDTGMFSVFCVLFFTKVQGGYREYESEYKSVSNL